MAPEPVRWLTDDEQRAWRMLAAVVLRLPAQLDRQLQRDAHLTHFEYWVLVVLSEAEDRTLQLKHLAAQSNASASRLSHVVRRMEDRGLVERQPCPGDARASNAVLTDAGWRKLVEAAPGHVDAVREAVFDGLDQRDVEDLERVCGRIVERLAAGPQGAADT